MVENETNQKIKYLRSGNRQEFTRNDFNEFCDMHGVTRKFSAPNTSQQNVIVERKNRTVQEVAKTMLNEAKLSDAYLREAVYTIVYILNRGQLGVNNDKTYYELWYGIPSSVKHFRVFNNKRYIKRS